MKYNRNKGFTLVETLAVIAILAIIALITTIIVTNIINEAKRNSTRVSAKNYITTVNNHILSSRLRNYKIEDGTYEIVSDGNLCLGTYSNGECLGDILDLNLESGKPSSGEVVISNRKVTSILNVKINGSTISYDAIKDTEIVLDDIGINNFQIARHTNSIEFSFSSINGTTFKCEYGKTNKYGNLGNLNVQKNQCVLEGLKPNTKYYYRVSVTNTKGISAIEEGEVTTLPITTPVILVEPSGYSKYKDVSITYEQGDLTDPSYYFYTTSQATSNISVIDCGGDFEPGECGSTTTSSLQANRWYKLGNSISEVDIRYNINSAIIAKTSDGRVTVGTSQIVITKIDNKAPIVSVKNIKYGEVAKIVLRDEDSGIQYYGVTSTHSEPSLTSTSEGNTLNTWYEINPVTSEEVIKNFSGLDAGTYYAWGKDALGNVTSTTFTVEKTKDIITIEPKTAVYTGNPIPANPATTLGGGNVTYTYYKSNNCSGEAISTPINVGNYSVRVESSDAGNYQGTSKCITHKITKADPIITVNPMVVVTTKNNTATITVKSNTDGTFNFVSVDTNIVTTSSNITGTANQTYTSTLTSHSDGDTYVTVNFTPADTHNFNTASKTIEVHVSDTLIIPTTETNCKANLVYNGENQVLTNEVSSIIYTNNVGKNAGSYTVTATIDPQSNYVWTDGTTTAKTFTCTIKPLTVTTSLACNNKIYDGTTTANCTITVTNNQGGDNISVGGSCTFNNANVGANKPVSCNNLTITGTNGSNYTTTGTTVTGTASINNAKLTFDANGGTLNGTSPLYVRKGQTGVYTGIRNSTAGEIPTSTRTGYVFSGWQSPAGVKIINADKTLVPNIAGWVNTNGTWLLTSNQTLTAIWANGVYSVTLDKQYGTGGTDTIYEKYDVAYYLNYDGTAVSNYMTAGQNFVVPPTRVGYTFAGYYTAVEGGTRYIDYDGKISSSANPTQFSTNGSLYAHWVPKVFTITLNKQGGTGGTDSIYEKYNVAYYLNYDGSAVSNYMTAGQNFVEIPTKTGYKFQGYYTAVNGGGTKYIDANGKITANVDPTQFNSNGTLYAHWTPYKLTLKYHANGGTITTDTTAATRYRVGSDSLIEKSTDSGATWSDLINNLTIESGYINLTNVASHGATKTGYTVSSVSAYNTKADGTGVNINQDYNENSQTNPVTVAALNGGNALTGDKTINIYINWVPRVFTITLNKQNGTGGTSTIYEKYNTGYYLGYSNGAVSNYMTAGQNYITVPTREGYAFGGYYTAVNGGGTQYIDANGKITSNASTTNFTANGTLYAKWIDNTLPTIIINHTGSALTATITDAESGVVAYAINDRNEALPANSSEWITVSNTSSYNVPSTAHTSGARYVHAKDAAGNITRRYTTVTSIDMKKNGTNTRTISVTNPGFTCESTDTTLATCSLTKNESDYTLVITSKTSNGTPKIKVKTSDGSTYITYNVNIDATAPTPTIAGGTTLKTATQTVTLKCSDDKGVTAYYFGTANPTSVDEITTTTSLSSLTGSGLSQDITASGTYYLACRDAVGNIGTTSIVIRKYQVQNVLLTLAGTAGTYTSANYATSGSTATYYIKDGTAITLANVYTTTAATGTFLGHTIAAPSDTAQTPSKTAPTVTNNTTKYYMWFNRTTFTVTLNAGNGGSLRADRVNLAGTATASAGGSNTLTVRYGESVKATAIPATGYGLTGFSGGYISGSTSPTTGAAITENKTITASFANGIYAITLDKQSGSGGTSTIYEKYNTGYYLGYANGAVSNYMTAGQNPVTVPTRSGYIFKGYYTSTNGGGVQYIDANGKITSNASTTNFTSNGTLYAYWVKNSYTVIYNANGGSGTMANQNIEYNVNQALTQNAFERPGYVFTGWSTSSSDTNLTFDYNEYSGTGASPYTDVKAYAVQGPFTPGDVYQLDFDAKGTRLTTYFYGESNYLQIARVTNSTGWDSTNTDGGNYVYLTNTYQHYSVRFVLGSTGDRNVTKVVLLRLDEGQTAQFKNVRFYKVSSSSTAYTDKQIVNNLTQGDSINLYAIWRPSESPTVTCSVSGTEVTGTGTTTQPGYLIGAKVTCTCTGTNIKPSTMKIDGATVSTTSSNGGKTITASKTINSPGTANVSATCTSESGVQSSTSTGTKYYYREFKLTFNKNGASSISSSGGTQYLMANSTKGDGGQAYKSTITRNTDCGSACGVVGWEWSSSTAKTARLNSASSIHLCWDGTSEGGVDCAYSVASNKSSGTLNVAGPFNLYAISYGTISGVPTTRSSFSDSGTSDTWATGYYPATNQANIPYNGYDNTSQVIIDASDSVRVFNTRRSAYAVTEPVCAWVWGGNEAGNTFGERAHTSGAILMYTYDGTSLTFDQTRASGGVAGFSAIPIGVYNNDGWWCGTTGTGWTLTINATSNGGTYTGTTPRQMEYGSRYNRNIGTPAVRTGYTFTGWYDDPARSTAVKVFDSYGNASDKTTYWAYPGTLNNLSIWQYLGNLTVYARWEKNKNTLTVNPNGGTITFNGTTTGSITSVTKEYNSTIEIPNPTRSSSTDTTGTFTVTYNANGGTVSPTSQNFTKYATTTYSFDGWSNSGVCSDMSGTTYTFPSNSGSTCTKTAAWTATVANSYVSPTSITLPTPSRTGYSFDGWYTSASGGTRIGLTGYSPTSGTTIYAHWTGKTYNVTFDPNYTVCSNPQNCNPASGFSKTMTYGSTTNNTVTGWGSRSGYTFAGWYTAASGGTQVFNSSGVAIAGTTYWDSSKQWKYAGTTTFYAHWTAN